MDTRSTGCLNRANDALSKRCMHQKKNPIEKRAMRGRAVLGRRIGILVGRLEAYGDFSNMKKDKKK